MFLVLEIQFLRSLLAYNFNFALLWIFPFLAGNIYPFLADDVRLISSTIVAILSSLGYGLNVIILFTFRYGHYGTKKRKIIDLIRDFFDCIKVCPLG